MKKFIFIFCVTLFLSVNSYAAEQVVRGDLTVQGTLTAETSLNVVNMTLTGSLTTGGANFKNVTTVNAGTYDLLITDYILDVTYTATGSVTSLTLLTAQVVKGRIIYIKDSGGNSSTYPIIIDTEGAAKIDGADTITINSNYGGVGLYCNGTNWLVQ